MPDYTPTYALYDPWTLMCFLRNAPLPLDTGYGHKPQLTELSRARPLVSILSEAIRLHRPADDAAGGVPGAVADLPSADELGAVVTSAADGPEQVYRAQKMMQPALNLSMCIAQMYGFKCMIFDATGLTLAKLRRCEAPLSAWSAILFSLGFFVCSLVGFVCIVKTAIICKISPPNRRTAEPPNRRQPSPFWRVWRL